MKKIRRQQDYAQDFGDVLVAVFRNRQHDLVVRDYALQHLGEWCLANVYDSWIETVFHEALLEVDSSLAGTALIALDKLEVKMPKRSSDEMAKITLALASNDLANNGSRAIAMAICSARGITNALPIARKTALETSVPLRMASVAYIGNYGQVEDLEWLNHIKTDRAIIIAVSTIKAIENITARSGKISNINEHKGKL